MRLADAEWWRRSRVYDCFCRFSVTSTPDNIDSVQKSTENFVETLPIGILREKAPKFFAEVRLSSIATGCFSVDTTGSSFDYAPPNTL